MIKRKILGLAFIAVLISGCSSLEQLTKQIQRPQAKFQSLSFGKISTTSIELLPVISINNSNMFPIPINNISYQLSLNNQQLISGNSQSIGTLPANGSKDITLALELTNQSLDALQQLLFKDGQVDYKINGKVNVVGLDIPFEQQSTLYMPQISIRNIAVDKASFDQIALAIEIDVTNKNKFQLPLENLTYRVSSNSTSLFEGSLQQQEIKSGQQRLTLPLTFNPKLIYSNVFSLLSKPNLPLTIEIKSPLFSTTQTKTINLGKIFK
jgi:LEA14-like dessication related protein